ncbi:winged helix-turn-helix transcriptional regulator [Streptomyces sp. NPDC004647]|uniref:winged helix-turn-helix transcriptional regulator n=1 Tax=Streptomyces sp. NPDC004647 TaxID=3154671 RepID=UPI0033A4B3FE
MGHSTAVPVRVQPRVGRCHNGRRTQGHRPSPGGRATDKQIAERLGMSLRSCQRHVATLMRELGARNRLHLGYLLHAQQAPARRAERTTAE